MRGQITFLTETPSAIITRKRFLVFMGAHVHPEVIGPTEVLGTFGAGIGFYAAVEQLVLSEIGFPSKIFPAHLTWKRSVVAVAKHVVSDTIVRRKTSVTLRTSEGFLTGVCPPMPVKMTFLTKSLTALVTSKRFLARVDAFVILECIQSFEAQRTLGAMMYLVHSLCAECLRTNLLFQTGLRPTAPIEILLSRLGGTWHSIRIKVRFLVFVVYHFAIIHVYIRVRYLWMQTAIQVRQSMFF